MLDVRGERLDEAVRQQDAEERADQRRADLVADLLRRAVDGLHRDDDAEHRGDDAEPRQRVADLASASSPAASPRRGARRGPRPSALRDRAADAAEDDHLHRIGQEVDRVDDWRGTSGTST